MGDFLRNLRWQEEGQGIAEYAVMLTVILAPVVPMIGTSAILCRMAHVVSHQTPCRTPAGARILRC